ncbi:MAG: 50S ribosomal protein L28, partial [Cutibacterium avidum]|nr:50S ribosomal protein L28 [Cutibacterium avidum]
SLGRQVTLTLTPKAMKEIDRRGVDVVIAEMLARGEKI